MAIRKNVNSLTTAEKAELVAAIKAVKASGKYNQYVLRHAQAPHTRIHRGPAFLPWHRQFLVEYEKDLQQAAGNPNLGLPYWDWAADSALPNPGSGAVWANDLMGGSVGHRQRQWRSRRSIAPDVWRGGSNPRDSCRRG